MELTGTLAVGVLRRALGRRETKVSGIVSFADWG
jgi:hypothetical protein